jgi:hypothetical protein
MKQKPIPAQKPVYEDYTIEVGTSMGYPVLSTLTAEDQEEAAKAGLTISDLIEIEKRSYGDWQRDC